MDLRKSTRLLAWVRNHRYWSNVGQTADPDARRKPTFEAGCEIVLTVWARQRVGKGASADKNIRVPKPAGGIGRRPGMEISMI